LFFTAKISTRTDDELLALFRTTGEERYFAELYSRYIYLTYGLCLNYLKTEAEAQDAVMELFEDVRQKVVRYDIRFFRAWLYNVAKNHCIRQVQKKRRQPEEALPPVFMESDDFPALFDDDNREARFLRLQQCIEKLPAPQKVAVKLFFLSDKSYADIMEITGFQLKSVKSYLQNGKRNLKICMDNET
jgi:RNA polymerase sigma-70 factor (ECF subfamily)